MTQPRTPLRILAPEGAAPLIARELSRRRFLSLAALAGGATVLAACTPGGDTTSDASPQDAAHGAA